MNTTLSLQAIHEGGLQVRARCGDHDVLTDYPLPGGPRPEGPTSLELLLASLATCAANGLAVLMRREGLLVEGLVVHATAQRRSTHPTVLEGIQLHFELRGGGCSSAQVEGLLELAEQRICPVWAMLSPCTPITRSLTLR